MLRDKSLSESHQNTWLSRALIKLVWNNESRLVTPTAIKYSLYYMRRPISGYTAHKDLPFVSHDA